MFLLFPRFSYSKIGNFLFFRFGATRGAKWPTCPAPGLGSGPLSGPLSGPPGFGLPGSGHGPWSWVLILVLVLVLVLLCRLVRVPG